MNKLENKPELSVIIPTLNEEKHLPILLKSLKSNIKDIDAEVIIVDANSKDKTIQIARESKIKNMRTFVLRKKKGPAYQRNYGASKAKAPWLLFLDADVILEKNFLPRALKEMEERKLDATTCYSRTRNTGPWEAFIYGFANLWMRFFEKYRPYAQCCIFMKKEIHDKIRGFDERISFGEDSEYVERAKKKANARFRILNKDLRFIISPRSFKKYGKISQTFTFIYLNLSRTFGRERKKKESPGEVYEKFKQIEPTEIKEKIKTGLKESFGNGA